jgi:hypothetical protein
MRRTSTGSFEYDIARKETKDDGDSSTEDIETVAADNLPRADCLSGRSCVYIPLVIDFQLMSRSDLERHNSPPRRATASMLESLQITWYTFWYSKEMY